MTKKTDVMRQEYRALNHDEQFVMKEIKRRAADLYDFLNDLGESREISLAKTKIEEAVMWSVKHVTR